MNFTRLVGLGLVLPALLAAGCADSEPMSPISAVAKTMSGTLIYGLTSNNTLISFSSGAPNKVIDEVTITGLMSGETITGIDFRPSDRNTADNVNNVGLLYGGSDLDRIYVIDAVTGVASAPSMLTELVTGDIGGFGFNPVPDRIRIHGSDAQNLRINPDNGATTTDVPLAYMTGDVNFGDVPMIGSLAYTNSDSDVNTGTELYAIDAGNDVLVELASPNNGQLTTVGSLGVNTGDASGFDIAGTSGGTAYATLSTSSSGKSTLYTIDLQTGAATKVGMISQSKSSIISIAVAP